MPRQSAPGHIFVLWDDGCDEVAAIALAARLRSAGLRTYLVGVQGREATGRHGLRLAADILLETALRMGGSLAALVLPCEPLAFAAAGDPRIAELGSRAGRQYALAGARLARTGSPPAAEEGNEQEKALDKILVQFDAAEIAQRMAAGAMDVPTRPQQ